MNRNRLAAWLRRYLSGSGTGRDVTLELVRGTGFAALLTAVWAVFMFVATGNPRLMEVQLEADPAVIAELRMNAGRLADARNALQLDFALIILYGLTFALLAVLLYRRGGRYRPAGALAFVGALATTLFDLRENLLTLDLLPAGGAGEISQSTLDTLQVVSYGKWGLSAATVLLIAFLFAGRGRFVTVSILAAVTFAVGLVGGVGFASTSPSILEGYFGLLLLVLVGLIAQLLIGTRFLLGY
jgi:hypothetical protein